jgi:hypothetical protein
VALALALLVGGCEDRQFCGQSVDDPAQALLEGLVCLGYSGPSNRPSLHASIQLNTYSEVTGTPVEFSTVRSTTPDPVDDPIAKYEWDFGDGVFVTGRPYMRRAFAESDVGFRTIRLRITDLLGFTAETSAELKITSDPGPSANDPGPTASFTASPNPAGLEEVVGFDASRSTVRRGRAILHHVWDYGDGSPPDDRGETHYAQHTYYTCGTMHVTLRVTDEAGSMAETTRDVSVSGAGCHAGPVARLRAARLRPLRAATPQLFSARITRARLVRAGKLDRRGGVERVRGLVLRGRLAGHMGGSHRLARFARARWTALLTIAAKGGAPVRTLHGLVLATFRGSGAGSACLAVSATRRGSALPSGSFRIVGGTGAAARMSGAGRFVYDLGPGGFGRLAGRLRATGGRGRPLPPACRRL